MTEPIAKEKTTVSPSNKVPSQTTITSLGTTRATSIAYDSMHGAIAIPQVSSADTFASLGTTQTLTNKTLTTSTLTDGTRNLIMPTL